MTPARARFAGVLEILQYNWHFYAASLCAVFATVALLWLRLLTPLGEALLIAAAALAVFWSIASLLASWYIYDHVGVTRWSWLPQTLPSSPRQWLNIHAGLDQSTPTLAQLFPNTEFTVLDIYDANEMTEPSIARARQLHPSSHPAIPAKLDALPLPDQTRDTVFLLFAAHEIRQPALRAQFFRELARVLTPSGQVLLVEHLRDWKNFLAFGPGFLHFHSRKEWLCLARAAGLSVESETPVTPFIRCFLVRKPSA
jgi:ubiquinone/menaquinone biosynthesis C-methylase UbiE